MLVAFSNAVKVESVPLNSDQFLRDSATADIGHAAKPPRTSASCARTAGWWP